MYRPRNADFYLEKCTMIKTLDRKHLCKSCLKAIRDYNINLTIKS